jgi:hypothetical protein
VLPFFLIFVTMEKQLKAVEEFHDSIWSSKWSMAKINRSNADFDLRHSLNERRE